MIKTKILLSLYSAFLAVFVLQFYFGGRGVAALEELKAYQQDLEENLTHLRLNHGKLRDQFELLKTHPETVKLAARDLGFFQKDEMVLKFLKDDHQDFSPLSPGKILTRKSNLSFQDGFFRFSWLALLVLFYLVLELLFRIVPPLGKFLAPEAEVRFR